MNSSKSMSTRAHDGVCEKDQPAALGAIGESKAANMVKANDGQVGALRQSGPKKLVSMADVTARPQEWLWGDRMPLGGITLLEGDPGHGKSTLMDDIAARVTLGRPMPFESADSTPHEGGVVLLKGEESLESVVRPRLEAAGADLAKIWAANGSASIRFPSDTPVVRQAAQEIRAKLVVIDPLPQFVETSLNSSEGTQRALGPLAAAAEQLNIAVVLVRHLGKGRAQNSLYRGLGSVSIIGLARSALLVGADASSDDKHRHMLAVNKSNLGSAKAVSYETRKQASGAITVNWLGTISHSVDALASCQDAVVECSELERAMDFLYGILEAGPKPQRAVLALASQADIAKRTLYRAKAAMKIRSKRAGKVCWKWELPSNHVEAVKAAKDRYVSELCDWLVEVPRSS